MCGGLEGGWATLHSYQGPASPEHVCRETIRNDNYNKMSSTYHYIYTIKYVQWVIFGGGGKIFIIFVGKLTSTTIFPHENIGVVYLNAVQAMNILLAQITVFELNEFFNP